MRLTRVLLASKKIPENYHNLPKRTIDRNTTFLTRRAPNLPQYEQKIFRYKRSRNAYYDQWRPWQQEFQRLNANGVKIPKIFVEPIRELGFYRGDRVEVLKGPDKGKQGIINYIVKERNWVFVQGLNMRREYMNSDGSSLGTISCKEEPYLVNHEVKLVDPSDLLPTEFEWRYNDNNERVRVSTRTEHVIPVPQGAYETIDYTIKSNAKEGPKDTPADEVNKVTFNPTTAQTFEMEICEKMNIKDDRVPYPMYWY